jgi:hypothetical protein
MSKTIERIKVLATTFVTYAVLVSGALSAATVVLQQSDQPLAVKAAGYATAAVGVLASIVKIVRNVTQVPADQVGILVVSDGSVDEFWS